MVSTTIGVLNLSEATKDFKLPMASRRAALVGNASLITTFFG